jgi:acyl-CoA hydrolase
MKQSIVNFETIHLVKSEDLNHHRTLFAGRTAEWFVESGFIAAASMTNPDNVVCVQLHEMKFFNSVKLGALVKFESKVVYTGRSSIYCHVKVEVKGKQQVEGFVTFVHVDENNNALPHGIEIVAETEEDQKLQAEAKKLKDSIKNKNLDDIDPQVITNSIDEVIQIVKNYDVEKSMELIQKQFLVVNKQDLDSYGKK